MFNSDEDTSLCHCLFTTTLLMGSHREKRKCGRVAHPNTDWGKILDPHITKTPLSKILDPHILKTPLSSEEILEHHVQARCQRMMANNRSIFNVILELRQFLTREFSDPPTVADMPIFSSLAIGEKILVKRIADALLHPCNPGL